MFYTALVRKCPGQNQINNSHTQLIILSVLVMYVAVARSLAMENFYIAFITGYDATLVQEWLDDGPVNNNLRFPLTPTLGISMNGPINFVGTFWIKSEVILEKNTTVHEWGPPHQLMPPVRIGSHRTSHLEVTTQPHFRCVGFTGSYKPILETVMEGLAPAVLPFECGLFKIADIPPANIPHHLLHLGD